MEIISKNNRTYLSLKNKYGDVLPFQLQIYATSGHGKGLAVESFIEKWKQATKGIVLCIADPKEEAEFSFVQYKPEKRYQLEKLQEDGRVPNSYPCKLYHPFCFGIPKSYLPQINFYTIPLNTLTHKDWTILAETSFESETIKLLKRVAEEIGRNQGLFEFLHEIQRRVQGKKERSKSIADPKNFYLNVGSGTAKSITEVANLLHPFRVNYFLRKETCPYAIDWSKILADNQSYHVFLSMWLKDEKLQEFCVLNLLEQIIENRHYAKKPILIVIPELYKLAPRNPQGYKFFLSEAISEAFVTMRSQGKGISSLSDAQFWGETADRIKGTATITLFGQLSTKDQEVVVKAMNYKGEYRKQLQNMPKNSYLVFGKEDYDPMRFFMPSHSHKEPEYNWIERYEEHFKDKMVRYDELVSFMRKEFEEEELLIKEKVKKQVEQEELEAEQKRDEREERKTEKEKPKQVKEDKNKDTLMKACYEMYHDKNLNESDRTFRKIGKKYSITHATVKKWISQYDLKLKDIANTPQLHKDNPIAPEN